MILKIYFILSILSVFLFPISYGKELKNREILANELKVVLEELWSQPGVQGENQDEILKMKSYINNNMASIYKEIDFIDNLVKNWDAPVWAMDGTKGEIKKYNSFKVFPEREGTLLDYFTERGDDYLWIMNDLAAEFDIKNPLHIKKLEILGDFTFFNLNKYNKKVQNLGVIFYEKNQGDEIFKILIKSWFPEALGVCGQKQILDIGDEAIFRDNSRELVNQKEKIIQFNQKWMKLLSDISNAQTQDQINACSTTMDSLVYPLLQIVSFYPPEVENTELIEICEVFFEKIYLPVTDMEVMEVNGRKLYTDAVHTKRDLLINLLNKFRHVSKDRSNAYLIDYSYNRRHNELEYILGNGG